jgi:AbrB family looped-hinge helix DNA binding protein
MHATILTSKGQITIPISVRKILNLNIGDRVSFILEQDKVEIVKVEKSSNFYGSIKARGVQNFKHIRRIVKKRVARRIVDETK